MGFPQVIREFPGILIFISPHPLISDLEISNLETKDAGIVKYRQIQL